MLKNTAGQFWRVFAFVTATGAPMEDDQDNITATIKLDSGSPAATNDVNPTQAVGKGGYYDFALTQAETNANQVWITPVSATSGVTVIGVPGEYSPSVNVAPVAPYTSRTSKVTLTKLSDYKTGTPVGPLQIPITAINVAVNDVVAFGAELCDENGVTDRIYIEGVVVSSGGSFYAQFEIEGSTDLDVTPSPFWHWGLEHTNDDGDVSAIVGDKELIVLPDRVVSA
ncbi:hypothetical protein Mal15_22090 [Stieleria maiorica]|uniref:Uncharacterized protein n=1 Tax=Stieleria maiorica TaxID=2795974 RepID=A0A5B9MA40_9BACT|nr:hypothetical protein [Stieleria maiorica]QEF98161.1 hypothetical protein Mal15_22090 [Stieleria maiorica]